MYILEDILDTLSARMQDAPAPLITAVDGRCAAGKRRFASFARGFFVALRHKPCAA